MAMEPEKEKSVESGVPVLDFVHKHQETLAKAPKVYWSLAAICFIAGFGLASLLFSIFILPGKEATVQALQAQIDSLKEQAHAGTIAKDEWRPLSDEESEEWIATLSRHKIRALSIYMSGTKTEKLGNSLYRVASNCGAMYPNAETSYTPKGISLSVMDDDPIKADILNLLKKYDPNVRVQKGGNIGVDDRGSGVEIYIGAEVDNR